jgi:DNA polymerase-3 subunit alpha
MDWKYELPVKGLNDSDYLALLVEKGAKHLYGEPLSEEVRTRINFELDTIRKSSYPTYFLILSDIVKIAKVKFDAWIGVGRGSAAGSIVNYCLGITTIDPMKYGLLFERFINPERKEYIPDIIIDIDDVHSHEVISWISNQYGEPHERIHLKFDNYIVDNASSMEIGILALPFLSHLKYVIDNIRVEKNLIVNINEIPIDDTDTLNMFKEGDVTFIYNMDDNSPKNQLRKLRPTSFSDLAAFFTVYEYYRHGIKETMQELFRRKKHFSSVRYDLPCMQDVLDETYGLYLYQEQYMILSQRIAGFTPSQSDELRKALGKKKEEKLKDLESLFLKGGEHRGYDIAILSKIWNDWKKDGLYSYNKSHIVCYTYMMYVANYLQVHYNLASRFDMSHHYFCYR